ncbi:3-deoxy-D-manno-octulosonic acid transferase [Lunatibacter salilacus]|uniref:3-deoxy-D-manno-octulosonic acid transferase n=1 Tax=Lunatibacter salilacus TaxID=2483804 RepID=UPI00131C88B6|nr:glycosyltransferase N-terminal domain-containing protein [Lunatibacter salilacus]
MRLIYNLGIRAMTLGIQLGSLKSAKLAQMVRGRNNLLLELSRFRKDADGPLVWIHVASLGEYEQAKPVIKAFKKSRPDWLVCVSFFSPSGYENVINKPQPFVDFITYLPFDSQLKAEEFVETLKPKAVFFVKYDLWYHHLAAVKRRNIPLFLIAAALRTDQVYFAWYGSFFSQMLLTFDHIFTQNQETADLLDKIGYSEWTVAGDPRYDNVEAIRLSPKSFPEINDGIQKRVFVAGSVWQEDMDLLIPYINSHSDYQYVIAPHDIRSPDIEVWEKAINKPVIRHSQLTENTHSQAWEVMIIDNIGMLSSLYQYARIAYVGGAFGKGLHNILEGLAFRIPVIFGWLKNKSKFPEWEISQSYGCGFAVRDAHSFSEIMDTMEDETAYKQACESAERLLQDNLGSAKKIMDKVDTFITTL